MPKQKNGRKGVKPLKTRDAAEKSNLISNQLHDLALPNHTQQALRLSYPIGNTGSDATMFVQKALDVLSNPSTAIYIDTSFLMWLTKGGTESRQQFFDWAAKFGDRIHVPLWSYHEYYRHHNHDTLRTELDVQKKKLREATKNYVELAKTYADDPLKPGFSSDAFHRELEDLHKKIIEVTETTAKWDYERTATHVSEWMSTRLCRSKVVFDLMEKLGQLGETRYTQDLPPGYRDRTKVDEKNKGSNKFGDLILWEELIAHIPSTGAKNVVILTRDRKDDWFARADAPVIEGDLLRLRDKQRWNPVPAPHPTLVFELRERTSAVELLLLDSLYFGAVLHQTGDASLARLIAYSLGMRSTAYVIKPPVACDAVSARPFSKVLSQKKLKALCDVATTSPLNAVQSPKLVGLRAHLIGDVPTVESFINQFGGQHLLGLSLEDTALFARLTADDALAPAMPMAQQMIVKLLELLPVLPADYASALFAGMLASAYYEDEVPRSTPRAWDLQKLFGHFCMDEYSSIQKFIGNGLRAARSSALFLPSAPPSQLKVRIINDSRQEQTPLALKQIALGKHNLLTNVGAMSESNLSRILGGTDSATVNQLLELVAKHYGLPLNQLDVTGAELDELRTLPAELGFVIPTDLETFEAGLDLESDAASVTLIDAEDVFDEDVLDEEKLEAQAFLEDDSDD